jgi:uncharacterized small protein (DUF1192 family)
MGVETTETAPNPSETVRKEAPASVRPEDDTDAILAAVQASESLASGGPEVQPNTPEIIPAEVVVDSVTTTENQPESEVFAPEGQPLANPVVITENTVAVVPESVDVQPQAAENIVMPEPEISVPITPTPEVSNVPPTIVPPEKEIVLPPLSSTEQKQPFEAPINPAPVETAQPQAIYTPDNLGVSLLEELPILPKQPTETPRIIKEMNHEHENYAPNHDQEEDELGIGSGTAGFDKEMYASGGSRQDENEGLWTVRPEAPIPAAPSAEAPISEKIIGVPAQTQAETKDPFDVEINMPVAEGIAQDVLEKGYHVTEKQMPEFYQQENARLEQAAARSNQDLHRDTLETVQSHKSELDERINTLREEIEATKSRFGEAITNSEEKKKLALLDAEDAQAEIIELRNKQEEEIGKKQSKLDDLERTKTAVDEANERLKKLDLG